VVGGGADLTSTTDRPTPWPIEAAGARPLRRALLSPHLATRLLALDVIFEEGLERHARMVATYLTQHPGDETVAAAARAAVLAHTWPESPDRWSLVLIGWAVDDFALGTSHTTLPASILRGSTPSPGRQRPSARAVTRTAIDLATLMSAAVIIGVQTSAFTGFPKGADAYGHVSKIELIVRTFPHIHWNPYWYAGLPHFESSYPPLFHLLGAAIVAVTGCSPSQAVLVVGAGSVLVATACLYAVATLVSRQRLVGLTAAGLFLSSPNLWVQLTGLGAYARLLALAFLGVAVLFTVLHVMHPSRLWLIAAVASLAATLATHLLVAIIACGVVGAILVLAPARSLRERAWRAATVGLPAVGLTAFFYLPFVVLPRPKTGAATGTYPPPWRSLVWPTDGARLDALAVVLVPAMALAAVGAFGARRGLARAGSPLRARLRPQTRATPLGSAAVPVPEQQVSQAAWGVAVGCAAVGSACVAFALAGHLGVHIPLYGLNTWDVYVDASWVLPIFVAGGTGVAIARWPSVKLLVPVIIVGSVAGVATIAPMARASAIDGHLNTTRIETQALFPAAADGQSDFRLGATTDPGGDWVGSLHSTPIVRGYQNQGTVNVEWQFWAERALHDKLLSEPARAFVLDWYAVKWLFSDDGRAHVDEALDADPSFQRLAASETIPGLNVYDNTTVSPIASATTAPAALVIASEPGYPVLFRALAPANAASTSVVPIDGGRYIDDISASDLAKFPTIVLYEAQAHSWPSAAKLLERYVDGGGRLFIEGAGMSQVAVKALGAISPVLDAHKSATSQWDFAPSSDEVLADIDPAAFGAARYSSSLPWEIASADTVVPDARVILSSGRLPIMVERRRGAGRVFWSGMNLPFHAASFENVPESRLLARLLSASSSPTSPIGTAARPSAEHEVVHAPAEATGVLFKETEAAGWQATIDGRPATTYSAGPGFMYVPLVPGKQQRVDFTYHAIPLDLAGATMSIATVLLLIAFGLRLPPPAALQRARRRLLGHDLPVPPPR
jgi:hypothetical protein